VAARLERAGWPGVFAVRFKPGCRKEMAVVADA
jgi:hypothetical protein